MMQRDEEEKPARSAPPPVPSAGVFEQEAEWDSLNDDISGRIQQNAERWSKGLAGFTGAFTGLLVFKGPDIGDIAQPARYIVAGLFLLTVAFMMVGLWRALEAQAPQMARYGKREFFERYASVRHFEVYRAEGTAKKLDTARSFVVAGLVTLLVAYGAWWSAPGVEDSRDYAAVKYVIGDGGGLQREMCGFVEAGSADSLTLSLDLNGQNAEFEIPFDAILSLNLKDAC